MTIHPDYNWLNLTPEPGHFAFGYYDRCPWDAGAERHLALRLNRQDRLPASDEPAVVGFVERATRRFVKVTETCAWSMQQGAMTMWLPATPDAFIFNDHVESAGRWQPVTRAMTVAGKEVARHDGHCYAMSRDGRWMAGFDFTRIPRGGYRYARVPFTGEPRRPDEDGVWLTDLASGRARLLVSYRQLLDQHPYPDDHAGHYFWLDQVVFNHNATRLMVLLRHAADARQPWPWRSHLFTLDLDGGNLRCLLPDIYWRAGAISHQTWGRTPSEILVDANWTDRGSEYVVVKDTPGPLCARRLSAGLGPAGHLSVSPDGRWIAADTYPDKAGIQQLARVESATGKITELGRFCHQTPGVKGETRCDLHPRWSRDGRWLTVDTVHEGDRKIFLLERPA